MNINKLSLKEKIGQKLLVGINDYNIEIIIDLIKNNYIGGVLLYKKNYHSYDEMLKVIKRLRDANSVNKIPLLIAIDQEGGVVNRFTSEILNLKNIYDASKTDKKLISDIANITSKVLSESGINMNLAPVLDIYNNSNSKALYKRCFYGNEKNIYNDAKSYIKEFNANGIITVCKHFPGHGATKRDSHFIIPYIFNYKEIINKHVLPFKDAIHDNVDAIMVGHFVIRRLSPFLPTSISSKFINQYLRLECHYNGVVISDEINMLSRNIIYKWHYLDHVFKSGTDIVLIKIKDRTNALRILKKAYRILMNDVRLDDSVMRIINLKNKYKLDDNAKINGINIDDINKKISRINDAINS